MITSIFAVLFGSSVGQIVWATREFDFSGLNLGVWWHHPLRLVLPHVPGGHALQAWVGQVTRDGPEVGTGAAAGLSLFVVAAVGVAQAKNRWRYAPLLILFGMLALSRPGFDLVRWMPWFAFTRVLSRSTVIYSVVFSLLALSIDLRSWRRRLRVGAVAGVGLLGAVEFGTVAHFKLVEDRQTAFPQAFYDHLAKIAALPGEAVLDFPSCILGGNGDVAKLCPFVRLHGVHAPQRFHHKDVIGAYLGRQHPRQAAPFVAQGWPRLYEADDPDGVKADKLRRCLHDAEWAFFSDFYFMNDFAGIQLAVDRLPPGCAAEFYRRFGPSMGGVDLPWAGRLEFIPPDPATRDRIDKGAVRQLRLIRDLVGGYELVAAQIPRAIDAEGLALYEILSPLQRVWLPQSERRQWRWALLPATTIGFELHRPKALTVRMRFRPETQGQVVTVTLDGQVVAVWDQLGAKVTVERQAVFSPAPGPHVLRFEYRNGNRGAAAWAPQEPRPLAVLVESLVVRSEPTD